MYWLEIILGVLIIFYLIALTAHNNMLQESNKLLLESNKLAQDRLTAVNAQVIIAAEQLLQLTAIVKVQATLLATIESREALLGKVY